MRKWILIFFSLTLGSQSMLAQDVVGCSQLLEDAKEAYAAGMVELVPELLLPCIESGGLSGTLKQDAYKLVINAYLFDYLPEEANDLMDNFVKEFPEYRASASDTGEFALLLNTHLEAQGIDPNEVAEVAVVETETETETQPAPAQQTKLKEPFEYGNSMGFLVGGNGSFPQMVEKYSMGNLATDGGNFGVSYGFQVGATMNLMLSRVVDLGFDLLFSQSSFNYTATPFSFTTYVYEESQSHLQLPVSAIFRLNPNSPRVALYIRAGLVADYMLSATGSGTRSYEEELRDVTVESTDVGTARSKFNLHAMAGLGVRIPLEKSFVFMEARYSTGLIQVNNGESRYQNQDLTWLLYHVDSDFRLNQLTISAGMAWNL